SPISSNCSPLFRRNRMAADPSIKCAYPGRPARLIGNPSMPEPIGTGNFSDSLHALVSGKVVQLRVPYPMGFFAKGVDGRIDDAKAGWKGRGLWVTSGNRTPMHIEGVDAPSPGAPGNTLSSPLVVHFQLRPDPLAH